MIHVAGDVAVLRRGAQELVEEILGVRRVFFRRCVALRHADQLQKAEPIGIRHRGRAFTAVPEIIAESVGVLRAVIAQMAKAVVAIETNSTVVALPEPGIQIGGCGCWIGRGHRFTIGN